jgi:hypothetical protein
MRNGQSAALTIGLQNHKIESCAYGRISERGACDWCCALFNAINQQSQRLCYIKNGPKWIEAFLLSSRVITVRNGYKVYEHMVTLEMERAFPVNDTMLKMSNPLNWE